jgi:hypothetical protein
MIHEGQKPISGEQLVKDSSDIHDQIEEVSGEENAPRVG